MTDSIELNLSGESPFTPKNDDDTSTQALGYFLLDHPQSSTEQQQDPGVESREGANGGRYDAGQLRTESVQQRVVKVMASAMPLLESAQPLLRALSEMPETIDDRDQVWLLKESLKNEITLFSVVCDEVDISWKKMAIVRYCLCTALDEAAHGRQWGADYGWSQSNLLNHFEGDNDGGNKFFLLVGRISMTPHEYADVLEILLRILGLGFEGRYSIIENGERQLTKIRQRLLTLLQSTRDSTPAELSPNALPIGHNKKRQWMMVPVRVSLLFAGVLAAGTFITSKYLLVVPQSGHLALMQKLAIVPSAPAASAIRLQLKVLLKAEIARKLLSVEETSGHSLVTFHGDAMFLVGAQNIRPDMLPVMKRVAQEIQRVKGRVRVIGHSDAMGINKPGLPNNQVLSEKRAASVAALIQQVGIAAGDIRVEGRGDRDPIASNQTAEGRAQNRRVDIFVDY
ncbi:type VI secretion system protein TssL, long form [Serratia inhibens]|uniref:type VI secretion system protein TssL, long form n=1 Tax=Serratia inhibens TaxID=2338073 RepID=UPI00025E3999|nr:type VI secretion system protein TssL, long form [Serratia inhibens]ANS44525.1 putative lipoprotein YiaD [Serratia inhibens PRI-2C]